MKPPIPAGRQAGSVNRRAAAEACRIVVCSTPISVIVSAASMTMPMYRRAASSASRHMSQAAAQHSAAGSGSVNSPTELISVPSECPSSRILA